MKFQEFAKAAILVSLFALPTAGCSVGDAPSGGSAQEVEANFQKMDPQEQIKIIQSGPAPAEKKAELIKAIEQKYGIKAGDAEAPHGAPTGGAATK